MMRKTTVPLALLATGIGAKMREECMDSGWYDIPALAAWSQAPVDSLEAALRASDEFEVRAGADMPEQMRVPRTGKGQSGYWPAVRLRSPAEISIVREHAARRRNAGALLSSWIEERTGVTGISATYDEGRGGFIVRGLSPDAIADAARPRAVEVIAAAQG